MAYKKKSKKGAKRTTRRRRRVGAVALNAKSPLVQFGSIAAGYFLGDTINPLIDKVAGTMDPKIVGAAEAGIGAALAFNLLSKGKAPGALQVAAGGILMGAGAKRLLKEFGVINGFQSVPVLAGRRMNGYNSVPVLGGYNTSRTAMNGIGGYRVGPRINGSSNVMGCAASGSGLTGNNAGSELMG
jgi:hypothetical protein